jgi:hypothetical protein
MTTHTSKYNTTIDTNNKILGLFDSYKKTIIQSINDKNETNETNETIKTALINDINNINLDIIKNDVFFFVNKIEIDIIINFNDTNYPFNYKVGLLDFYKSNIQNLLESFKTYINQIKNSLYDIINNKIIEYEFKGLDMTAISSILLGLGNYDFTDILKIEYEQLEMVTNIIDYYKIFYYVMLSFVIILSLFASGSLISDFSYIYILYQTISFIIIIILFLLSVGLIVIWYKILRGIFNEQLIWGDTPVIEINITGIYTLIIAGIIAFIFKCIPLEYNKNKNKNKNKNNKK